jgi:outer membrane lipoprotein-sorting protein
MPHKTFRYRELLLGLTLLWMPGALSFACAQVAESIQAPLNAEQVVARLVQMNVHRVQALQSYQGTRTYRAEYRGLGGTRAAEMVVRVAYLSPGTKEFSVQSVTGSKLIIDKVFKKLLDAEKEALTAETQRRSALTEDNYRFTMLGYEDGPSGATYVLRVDPRSNEKFLYRGKIWVDASDFAVVRLEAEPAKNPSFWTKKTEIEHRYMKVGEFWLPARNHSTTAIRLGGHAELTIEYNGYEITAASEQVGSSTPNTLSRAGRR